jgi:hypothetical protein
MVLARFSSVFQELFEKEVNEYGVKIRKITIEDIDSETMQIFITFLYTGRIINIGKRARSFAFAVEKYRVRDPCFHKLRKSVSEDNAWATLLVADLYAMPLLFNQCVGFLF